MFEFALMRGRAGASSGMSLTILTQHDADDLSQGVAVRRVMSSYKRMGSLEGAS